MKNIRRLWSLFAVITIALATAIVCTPTPASAAGSYIEFESPLWYRHATSKKVKGGIKGAVVECYDGRLTSYRVRVQKKSKTVYTWSTNSEEAAMSGQPWFRVKKGTYRVTTTVRCGDATKSVSKKIKIRRLADRQTISPSEFKQLRLGVSQKRVKKIIGGWSSAKDCATEDDGYFECYWYSTKWSTETYLQLEDGKLTDKSTRYSSMPFYAIWWQYEWH